MQEAQPAAVKRKQSKMLSCPVCGTPVRARGFKAHIRLAHPTGGIVGKGLMPPLRASGLTSSGLGPPEGPTGSSEALSGGNGLGVLEAPSGGSRGEAQPKAALGGAAPRSSLRFEDVCDPWMLAIIGRDCPTVRKNEQHPRVQVLLQALKAADAMESGADGWATWRRDALRACRVPFCEKCGSRNVGIVRSATSDSYCCYACGVTW